MRERHTVGGEEKSRESIELVDWEDIFKKHLEETRKIEKEREEKIDTAEKKTKSWLLLRECTRFLRENEKKWQFLNNQMPKMKRKEEEKTRRLELAKIQKEETLKKVKQMKIQES